MKIESIRLRNFRGFTDIKVDLHPRMTVLVGENGAGKSSLIDALAYAIAATAERIMDVHLWPVAEDIRTAAFEVSGVVDLQPQSPMTMDWRVQWDGESFTLLAATGGGHWTRQDGDWSRVRDHGKNIRDRLQGGEVAALPIVLRIPSIRAWSPEIQPSTEWKGNRQKGYGDWHNPAANQQQTIAWLRKQTYMELQEGEGSASQLAAVSRAILTLMPGLTNVEYRVRYDALLFTMADGDVIAFDQLSDGERNMVATAADIAYRCAVLNPQFGADAGQETEGIVLIDEVDLHLHPRWQREVLKNYRRAFPKIQFVVTTHSPQVLASAKREWVRLLQDDQAVASGHVEGRDSNSILEDIFGVNERPPEDRARIEGLFKLIDGEEYGEARQVMAELLEQMGPDDPDLTRAQWLIDAGEG